MNKESQEDKERSWVYGVVRQLKVGESATVIGGGKERSLTVTTEPERIKRQPDCHNVISVEFEGYGTEYTLEVPESGSNARLLYPSSDTLGDRIKDIELNDVETHIVAEQTVEDLGIPHR